MNVDDYIYCIANEIGWFETKYNKSPSMIIMSSALAHYISNALEMCNPEVCVHPDGAIGYFYGTPFMTYASDKLEFHLVEKTIHMD